MLLSSTHPNVCQNQYHFLFSVENAKGDLDKVQQSSSRGKIPLNFSIGELTLNDKPLKTDLQ